MKTSKQNKLKHKLQQLINNSVNFVSERRGGLAQTGIGLAKLAGAFAVSHAVGGDLQNTADYGGITDKLALLGFQYLAGTGLLGDIFPGFLRSSAPNLFDAKRFDTFETALYKMIKGNKEYTSTINMQKDIQNLALKAQYVAIRQRNPSS